MSQIVLGSPAPLRSCPAASTVFPALPAPPCRFCSGSFCVRVEPRLLSLWWAPGAVLGLTDVAGAAEVIRDVSDGYRLPLVVHLQGMVGIAAAARTLILESSLSSRIAYVGTGPVDQVIAAFLDQGLSETRYFECPRAAQEWALGGRDG